MRLRHGWRGAAAAGCALANVCWRWRCFIWRGSSWRSDWSASACASEDIARVSIEQGDEMNDTQHGRLQLQVDIEKRTLKSPFRITGYTFTGFDALVVTLREGGCSGRGEAQGVYYKHDNPPEMLAQVEALRGPTKH